MPNFEQEWVAMIRKWKDSKAAASSLGWLDLDMDRWESPDFIYLSACDQVKEVMRLAVREDTIRPEFSTAIQGVKLTIAAALKHNQSEEKYEVMLSAMIDWLSEYPSTGEFADYYQQAIQALQT